MRRAAPCERAAARPPSAEGRARSRDRRHRHQPTDQHIAALHPHELIPDQSWDDVAVLPRWKRPGWSSGSFNPCPQKHEWTVFPHGSAPWAWHYTGPRPSCSSNVI
ncbi:hypothetical protein SKAU_G00343530 [Synaphobranchus kaupii]|uniref:Uncharacterized protein n=1 Tax=Synaphobranchus kaupii TaxID=118154 RepID=A0A9Q1IGH9_SYNKA|nr:hypothetical protein SKAU_G00343530 [Synaphobranchus kaupii]